MSKGVFSGGQFNGKLRYDGGSSAGAIVAGINAAEKAAGLGTGSSLTVPRDISEF